MSATSATGLDYPNGVVTDAHNDLYVADGGNNRILYFPSGTTTATAVYGQSGLFDCGLEDNNNVGTCAGETVSADSLDYPHGLSVGPDGTLYVADHNNNRVLAYAAVVPTGTVTFKDGSTTLGTGTLSGDPTATLTTSSLIVGTHPITAAYGGDERFAASTSSVLDQVVNAAVVPVPATGSGEGSLGSIGMGTAALLMLGGLITLLSARRRPRRRVSG